MVRVDRDHGAPRRSGRVASTLGSCPAVLRSACPSRPDRVGRHAGDAGPALPCPPLDPRFERGPNDPIAQARAQRLALQAQILAQQAHLADLAAASEQLSAALAQTTESLNGIMLTSARCGSRSTRPSSSSRTRRRAATTSRRRSSRWTSASTCWPRKRTSSRTTSTAGAASSARDWRMRGAPRRRASGSSWCPVAHSSMGSCSSGKPGPQRPRSRSRAVDRERSGHPRPAAPRAPAHAL